ncbi:hypothetical protein [Amycolatopsis sp. NPDC059657]
MAMFDSFKKANEIVRNGADDAVIEEANAQTRAEEMRQQLEDQNR